MAPWLVEAWLLGESMPFISTVVDDRNVIGQKVQEAFDSGANVAVVTGKPELALIDSGTFFPEVPVY